MKITLSAFADEAAADLHGQIEALRRNNITKIELRNLGGVNIKDLSESDAEKAAAAFAAAGISVWSIGSPIGKSDIGADFAQVQRDLKHILRLCKIFHCDKIRVFSFYTTSYGEVEGEVLRRLRLLVKEAGEQGVTLYHENEKDIFGDVASRVETILDGVEGLKSIFDPANYLQVGESAENMARMRARADYFHIKDVIRATGELVPAGEGDGDIPAMIAELGRDAVFTLEPHLSVFSGYAAIDRQEMKNKYQFSSNGEAFDAAAAALKKLFIAQGYREVEGGFEK